MSADELVDIVDRDDSVVEVATRRRMRAERLRHRTVGIAIVDRAGRLLIHRRSMAKDAWPGWWDVAAGGVVAAGEDYETAAVRELAEELGVTGVELELVGDGQYEDDSVAVNGRCYRVVHEGPFAFADGEVTEVRWVTGDELHAMCADHRFLPDSWAMMLPLLGFGAVP